MRAADIWRWRGRRGGMQSRVGGASARLKKAPFQAQVACPTRIPSDRPNCVALRPRSATTRSAFLHDRRSWDGGARFGHMHLTSGYGWRRAAASYAFRQLIFRSRPCEIPFRPTTAICLSLTAWCCIKVRRLLERRAQDEAVVRERRPRSITNEEPSSGRIQQGSGHCPDSAARHGSNQRPDRPIPLPNTRAPAVGLHPATTSNQNEQPR